MNYKSFVFLVSKESVSRPNLALGTVYLDFLDEMRPDLADKLRDSPHDPYNKKEVPIEAEQLVEREWDDNTEYQGCD